MSGLILQKANITISAAIFFMMATFSDDDRIVQLDQKHIAAIMLNTTCI